MTEATGVPAVAVTVAPASKPGWKTTEFYLALAAKLLGAAYTLGLIGDGTTVARIAGLAAVALASLGYSVSRGLAKGGS